MSIFPVKGFTAADDVSDQARMHADLDVRYQHQMWTGLYLEAKQMRELLHAVNEATGPGSSEHQLKHALQAVSDYLSPLNEQGK